VSMTTGHCCSRWSISIRRSTQTSCPAHAAGRPLGSAALARYPCAFPGIPSPVAEHLRPLALLRLIDLTRGNASVTLGSAVGIEITG
jgi:hypothetical protein